MSGTKHEKTVLILLSYIIGFTSGLMAVNLFIEPVPMSESVHDANFLLDQATSAVAETYSEPAPDLPAENVLSTNELVSYTDGKLYAKVGDARVVLSVDIDLMGDEVSNDFANQGIHFAKPVFKTSTNGTYIFFCEQHTVQDICTGYIFDLTNNEIRPMSSDGKALTFTSAVAETALWTGGSLQVGNLVSISDTEKPWKLESR